MSRLRRLAGTTMNLSQLVTVFFLMGMLSACGFHLRGVATLPPQLESIELQADTLSVQQVRLLRQSLEQAGASLSETGSSDRILLSVSIRSLPDRTLVNSIGADTVVVRVSRELSYSLTSSAGERLENQRTIMRRRDLTLNNNNPLGIEYEKESASESLDRELISQLVSQLEQFQSQ
jgi:LPS-assembly lipoprotein